MKSPHHQVIECPREADVLDALASARWPDRVDEELTRHVASCEVCQDVITVSSAMQQDHEAALDEWNAASVPSSGQMWWRAEMRARQEAIRDASRPVTIAQGVAVGLALAVAGIAGWFAWPTVQGFVAQLLPGGTAETPATSVASAFASPMFLPLAVVMLAMLVVAPVALYFVISEKS